MPHLLFFLPLPFDFFASSVFVHGIVQFVGRFKPLLQAAYAPLALLLALTLGFLRRRLLFGLLLLLLVVLLVLFLLIVAAIITAVISITLHRVFHVSHGVFDVDV